MKEYYKNYINHIYQGLCDSTYHINQVQANSEIFFEKLNNILLKVQRNNGTLFFFGNGASASFSNHMALDWSKNGGILALCLSDSAMLTALANDYDYESEFLKINSPTNDDFVITTSSSGNSLNIVKVLEFCNKNKIGTLALSGLNNNNKSMKISEFSLFDPLKPMEWLNAYIRSSITLFLIDS